MFQNCTNLTEVNLPNTLVSIGECSFTNCTLLESVTGLENVVSIGNWCFVNCPITTDVLNLRDIETIGVGAFYGIKAKKIIFGQNLTSISGQGGGGCFSCSSNDTTDLEEVVFEGNNVYTIGADCFSGRRALATCVIPQSVVSIGQSAFNRCPFGGTINLPNLTTLGAYSFTETKITEITNLGVLQTVQDYAFDSCSELVSAIIPRSITRINSRAFGYCSKLESVTINNDTSVPTLANTNVFTGCLKLSEILVPAALIHDYYAASNWNSRDVSLVILPKETGNDVHAVIDGFWYVSGSTAKVGYCLTFCIPINPGHSLTFRYGTVGDGDGNGIMYLLDANRRYVNFYSELPSPQRTETPATISASIRYVRMCLPTADLANCYIYDETDQQYIWKGSEVTTIYQ